MQYFTKNEINMKFTGNYGGSKVEFLDVQIMLQDGALITSGYKKANVTNALASEQFSPPTC